MDGGEVEVGIVHLSVDRPLGDGREVSVLGPEADKGRVVAPGVMRTRVKGQGTTASLK